jgi:hypothetical protein
VLMSSWRRGDPELPFYVLAVALLTAVSGASHAIAGPAIVRIIGDESRASRDTGAVTQAVLDEAARVTVLLALAVAAAGIGVTWLLPEYAGMHRWLPAVAVSCLASRLAYFPTLSLIVADRRRVVAGVAACTVAGLVALLYGLAELLSAPTSIVLWSGALATCGYAAALGVVVLGMRAVPALSILLVFTALMIAVAFTTVTGAAHPRASLTSVALVCLTASAAYLAMRGPSTSAGRFSRLSRSLLDHAVRSVPR